MIQPEITRKLKFSDFVNKINLYKAHKQGGDRVVSAASTGVKLWYVVFCCIYLLGIYSNFFLDRQVGGWGQSYPIFFGLLEFFYFLKTS